MIKAASSRRIHPSSACPGFCPLITNFQLTSFPCGIEVAAQSSSELRAQNQGAQWPGAELHVATDVYRI
eukprot:scaffold48865_cov21-Prasinocladus_malaysianus.AAC.1